MKRYSDLEYLKLSKWERFKYRFVSFFASIPVAIWHAILGIGGWFKKAGLAIASEVKDIVMTFIRRLENQVVLSCHGLRQHRPGPGVERPSVPAL